MSTLLAFIFERLLRSVIDIFLAGVGGYLLTKKGRSRGWGGFMVGIYIVSLIGTMMSPNFPNEVESNISYIIGTLSFIAGAVLGKKRNRPDRLADKMDNN